MNQENNLDVLTNFVINRSIILNNVALLKVQENTVSQVDKTVDVTYTNTLMPMMVSKLSKFSDNIWDFNEDYPNAARNVQGARLRIDFSQYAEIPIFVITEIKVLLHLALLNNLIFRPKTNSKTHHKIKKSRMKGNLKPQSLTLCFSAGLSFLNLVFKEACFELGKEFVHKNIKTLSDINYQMYANAAKKFERTYGVELQKFFKYLYSSSASEYVFGKRLPFVELNNLEWNKNSNTKKERKNQILPDKVFETLSKLSSYIVLDFLEAIGDKEKISDIASFERLKVSQHGSWADKVKLNRESLNAYIALRLANQGYDSEYIENVVEPFEWLYTIRSKVISEHGLRKKFKKLEYKGDNLRKYFSLLNYACIYLVGQYTGMRPSELAEIRVNDCECLVEENGNWLIKSTVKKHVQEINTGLFDDKWIAIAIVRDAILAASYLSKVKSSPYFLSSIHTVPPNEKARPMDSNGIKYQMNKLICQLMGAEIANLVDFNAYMLRHTLAYQLFRADVGLPLISFQLKHFVDNVTKYTSSGATSSVTLGYGAISEMISKGDKNSYRRKAELESVKNAFNPKGTYYGGKSDEIKQRATTLFQGYAATGLSNEEIYEAMVDQGIGVVNVGQGLCYGGRFEEFDDSLPCIGSLRCNPARCSQAVVTESHAPKWREVYILNKANLDKPEYAHNRDQILAVMNEAKLVLENLGEEVEL